MLILGIETSTSVSSVALWDGGDARVGLEVARGRGHVELLMPAIEQAFDRVQRRLSDLEGVAVGIGPGSFTGMRVGIATAKTIAATLDLSVAAVSSLDLLARGHAGRVCACIDARRGEVFAAIYDDGARTEDPALWAPSDLLEHAPGARFIGDGARLVSPDGIDAIPSADALCEIALERFARGEVTDAGKVEPLYIRRTDAEIKWEQRGVTIERPLRVKIPKAGAR